MVFDGESVGQVVERNGVLYRDYQFRNDSLFLDHAPMSKNNLITTDEGSLPFIKNDFIVNSFDGDYGADQNRVCGAMDGSGNYAFTWIDYRNSQEQIYVQFFNSDDQRIGINILVNEDPLNGNNSPFISVNKNGNFVIVWLRDFRVAMAQRYNKYGQKVGNNILVTNTSGWNTSEPSVAVSNDGSFMVMWSTEFYSGNNQIYAMLFDSLGNSVGQQINVNDYQLSYSSIGRGKTIDVDQTGKYCLTWSAATAPTSSKIYLQIINSFGQKIGGNVLVSSPNDSSRNYFPDIVSTDDGHFLITWEKDFDYPLSGGGVGGRIFHSDGYFITDDFSIYRHPGTSWNPVDVSSDKDSVFIVLWLGYDGKYLQKIKSNGEYIGDTVKVSYNSSISGYGYYSGLTDMFDNHFFIAPEIYVRHDQNIYLQKFNFELQPIGAFNKIHDDIGSSSQKKSFVKFNKLGGSIVLWEDQRNGRFDLFAQVYDAEFNPMGGNIQINETDKEYWLLQNKTAESLSDGTFVIAFSGNENYSTSSAFLQLVSNSGEKIGNNKLVKQSNNYYEYDVSLSVDSNDEILVCWYNQNGASMRIFDKNLNNIIPEKTLLHSSNNISFNPITVSVDSLFNTFISYVNYDYQNYSSDNKIRGKFFDKNGNGSSGFIIDSVNTYIAEFICKNKGNNFVIFYRDGTKIYLKRIYDKDDNYTFENSFSDYSYSPTQLNIVEFDNQKVFVTYNSNLDVIGFYANDNRRETESYLLHQYEFIDPYYDNYNGSNSSDILNDKIIFSYENPGNEGTGYDIWANVRKNENVNFESELFYPPADYDVLYNNFPNPFNSKTKIAYELLSYHNVKLIIYDILGREVKILVSENQEKGLYEVEFDASSLASGIYFYKLEAFNTTVKKMILLK